MNRCSWSQGEKVQKKETGKEMWAMPHTVLNESLLYIDIIYVLTI